MIQPATERTRLDALLGLHVQLIGDPRLGLDGAIVAQTPCREQRQGVSALMIVPAAKGSHLGLAVMQDSPDNVRPMCSSPERVYRYASEVYQATARLAQGENLMPLAELSLVWLFVRPDFQLHNLALGHPPDWSRTEFPWTEETSLTIFLPQIQDLISRGRHQCRRYHQNKPSGDGIIGYDYLWASWEPILTQYAPSFAGALVGNLVRPDVPPRNRPWIW